MPTGGLLSRRAFAAITLGAPVALGLGRTPLGGTLRLSLPFVTGTLDPHAADDPLAALFGPAVADPLYALDAEGRPYPALATGLPEATAGGARLSLRAGLVSARGKRLDARDLLFSLERSRRQGGVAVLAELGVPVLDPKDPLAIVVPGAEPAALAVALASPLTALLPRGFSPAAPDGTGAFRATPSATKLFLERNLNAARGPAFLAAVELTRSLDLADALRAFEAGQSDVGFLGAGLHRMRPGALGFQGPEYGFVVLRSGKEARGWGAPGVLQGLADRIPEGALKHLGVATVGGRSAPGPAWGGGAAELLVDAEAPLLVSIADALVPELSGAPPLTVRSLPRRELLGRRAGGAFVLMLDVVRPAGPPGRATLLSLLAAASPDLAARPPRTTSYEPRDVARTLPLGVVGALRLVGARVPELGGIDGFQLGNAFFTRA